MIDPEKVKKITGIAVYEKGPGRTEIPQFRQGRKGYVGLRMLWSGLSCSLAYLIGFCFYSIHLVMDILDTSLTMENLHVLGVRFLCGYFIMIGVSLIIAWRYYEKKFTEIENHVKIYNERLTDLKIYMESQNALSAASGSSDQEDYVTEHIGGHIS